jgi:hypothetical protein
MYVLGGNVCFLKVDPTGLPVSIFLVALDDLDTTGEGETIEELLNADLLPNRLGELEAVEDFESGVTKFFDAFPGNDDGATEEEAVPTLVPF